MMQQVTPQLYFVAIVDSVQIIMFSCVHFSKEKNLISDVKWFYYPSHGFIIKSSQNVQ